MPPPVPQKKGPPLPAGAKQKAPMPTKKTPPMPAKKTPPMPAGAKQTPPLPATAKQKPPLPAASVTGEEAAPTPAVDETTVAAVDKKTDMVGAGEADALATVNDTAGGASTAKTPENALDTPSPGDGDSESASAAVEQKIVREVRTVAEQVAGSTATEATAVAAPEATVGEQEDAVAAQNGAPPSAVGNAKPAPVPAETIHADAAASTAGSTPNEGGQQAEVPPSADGDETASVEAEAEAEAKAEAELEPEPEAEAGTLAALCREEARVTNEKAERERKEADAKAASAAREAAAAEAAKQRAQLVGYLGILIELRADTPRGMLSFETAGVQDLRSNNEYSPDSPWTKFVDRCGARAFYYHSRTKQVTLVAPKHEGCWRLDRSFKHFDGWWGVLTPQLSYRR